MAAICGRCKASHADEAAYLAHACPARGGATPETPFKPKVAARISAKAIERGEARKEN